MKQKYSKAARWQAKLSWFQRNGYVVNTLTKTVEHLDSYRKAYGAPPKGWHVHHINHVKTDNRSENLIALPAYVHARIHQGTSQYMFYNREELQPFVDEYLSRPKYWNEIEQFLEGCSRADLTKLKARIDQYCDEKTDAAPKSVPIAVPRTDEFFDADEKRAVRVKVKGFVDVIEGFSYAQAPKKQPKPTYTYDDVWAGCKK